LGFGNLIIMDKYLKIALNAVKKSGAMLAKEYGNFNRHDIRLKSHHEIVTRFDLLSEEVIINELRRNFPAHGIVSEEKGEIKGYGGLTWYIDPIDGTTNFAMHNPLWCVSLALAEAGELVLGIIYAPIMDELFVAVKNGGAELNGQKIKVSNIKEGKVLNTYCHGKKLAHIKKAIAYYRKQKLAEFDCRQLGSAALELAYVACGRVESFLAPGANDWDVAAGVVIVREAGGKVTDFANRPWQLGRGDIAASNGLVHGQILKAVNGK
jgi:myo-inositol-1(or 4)-monophosphatase